ncbi:MAG: copper chaperone PCu(A)C [Acidobacteria bacterium]|nr:MAG: copper chaperone PCu(A)C [Acidobacteriota bacterium]
MRRRGFPPIVLGLFLAACAGGGGDPVPPAVTVSAARAQVMPGMGHGAAYFTVHNAGPQDDRLLAVETPAARVAELHESLEQDGVMRMVAHPDGLPLPAGGDLVLAPGGKHVMLIDPQLPAGARSLPLTLRFERAGELAVDAELMGMGGS